VPYTPLVQNPKGGESIALYYEYDSAVLHPRAQAQLKIVANVLKASPAKKLKITGHTDALGSDTYNIALSQRRAEAVKQFFLDQGVPVAQVETVGFGKTIPLSPNLNPDGSDNPLGRSHNRRAEILLDF
jgi:outer membrane protein OmpA-like peptidoglycan-associated protein